MSVNFQVNVNVKTNGQQAIDQLEQKINNLKSSSIPINFDVSGAEEIKNVLNQLNAVKKRTIKIDYDVGSSGKGKSIPDQIQKQLNSQKIKYDIDTGKYDASLSRMTKQLDAYGGQASDSISRAKASLESYQRELSSLQDHFSGKKILNDEEFTASVERMNKAGDTFKNTLSEIRDQTTKTLQLGVAERSANKVEAYYNANTKAAKKYGAELKDLEQRYRSITTQGEKMELDNVFSNLRSRISAEGLTGKSTLQGLKDSFGKVMNFAGLYGMAQNIITDIPAKVVQAVRDVNAAQIELTKVSDAPQAELSQYWDEAADSAKKYGAAISDVISSTADWSRLGYSLNEAKELSDATTLLQRVGDNMTQESSAQGMISTLKGFNLEADQALDIVDKVNEVANTQPIDTSGMFESLQRSASSMSAANNSLEQTMALITAANSVVQDPDRIGNAFKTISMRIRGASTELEEAGLDTEGMAESTAKLREEVLALSGVDIMKSDSEFRSTYDILDELATKWQDLTDIEQASLTELIAGKHQGNVISALMSNFDIARQTLQTATSESAGSAERELSNYQKGIEYSLDKFKATFQDFSTSFLDSNLVKGVVDTGSGLLDGATSLIDGIGAIQTVVGGFAAFKGIKSFVKNFDSPKITGTVNFRYFT